MFDLSNITLKPCPFCGGEAYISMHLKPHIECFHKRNCKIRPNTWLMSSYSLRKQIKAWNQRNISDDNQATHKQQNDLKTQSNEIHIGEVVYTKSDVCVLDIGLVERLNPLRVCARSSKYNIDGKAYYGNPSRSNWYGASMAFLTNMIKANSKLCSVYDDDDTYLRDDYWCEFWTGKDLYEQWINGSFTKVVLRAKK